MVHLDSRKKAFLTKILGQRLADEIVARAEDETVSLESEGIVYKAPTSWSEFDEDLDLRMSQNIVSVFKTLQDNILASALGPEETTFALIAANKDFTDRLSAALSKRQGRPRNAGRPERTEMDRREIPYSELRWRQRRAEAQKTRASRNAAGPYVDDLLFGTGQKPDPWQVEELRNQGGAAAAVGDLVDGEVIRSGAPVRQPEGDEG